MSFSNTKNNHLLFLKRGLMQKSRFIPVESTTPKNLGVRCKKTTKNPEFKPHSKLIHCPYINKQNFLWQKNICYHSKLLLCVQEKKIICLQMLTTDVSCRVYQLIWKHINEQPQGRKKEHLAKGYNINDALSLDQIVRVWQKMRQ